MKTVTLKVKVQFDIFEDENSDREQIEGTMNQINSILNSAMPDSDPLLFLGSIEEVEVETLEED